MIQTPSAAPGNDAWAERWDAGPQEINAECGAVA